MGNRYDTLVHRRFPFIDYREAIKYFETIARLIRVSIK